MISEQNIVKNDSLEKSVMFYKGQFFSRKNYWILLIKCKVFKDLGYMDAQIIPILTLTELIILLILILK